MPVAFAALVGAVAVYCGCRIAVPAWRDKHHPVGMDLTHVVMGAVMVAMFVAAVPVWANGPAVAVFAGATTWLLAQGLRAVPRAAVLRLSATCLAMTYMLMPAPANAGAGHETGHRQHQTVAGAGHSTLDWVLIATMIGVATVAMITLLRPHRTQPARLSSACELVMAAAMAYMLAL